MSCCWYTGQVKLPCASLMIPFAIDHADLRSYLAVPVQVTNRGKSTHGMQVCKHVSDQWVHLQLSYSPPTPSAPAMASTVTLGGGFIEGAQGACTSKVPGKNFARFYQAKLKRTSKPKRDSSFLAWLQICIQQNKQNPCMSVTQV